MNTTDQYLKTIYVLQRTDDSPASTGAVADRLGVSPASANEMIGKLAEHGLVEHEKYNETVVTEEDEQRARVTVETYCVIQRFLHTVLDIEEYRSEAHSIESVLDATVVERLDTLIDRCPVLKGPKPRVTARILIIPSSVLERAVFGQGVREGSFAPGINSQQ